MPNIAFFLNKISNIGGIEKITSILSNEFVNHGNVFIFTYESDSHMSYSLDEKVRIVYLKKNKNKIRNLLSLNKTLKRNKIKFLIIQDKNYGYFTYLKINKLSKYKIIFCDHSSFNYYYQNNIFNEVERREKYTKHADAVVVLTSDNHDLYKNKFGYKENKVYQIPNFLDFDVKNYDYNVLSKTITAVGRLHKQKRFDLLIDAFEKVNEKHPDWSLEIYGDGEEYSKLNNQIISKKLQDCVFLKGNYKNIDEAYLNKSFLCASSEFEGFGIMILEAISYKLPVISFNCLSGPSDMIKDGYNGFLVLPLDVTDMACKINKLIENKEARVEFSKNSVCTAKEFNKEVIVNKWYTLFANLKK